MDSITPTDSSKDRKWKLYIIKFPIYKTYFKPFKLVLINGRESLQTTELGW